MADFLWALSAAQLPEALFDWQRTIYGLQVPLDAASRAQTEPSITRLAVWSFRGEQPLASGLAALFTEYFRWLGPSVELLVTRFDQDETGVLPWASEMMQIDPENYLPEHLVSHAKLWGALSDDALEVHFAGQAGTESWALHGDVAQIAAQLLDLVPHILGKLGINATHWTPEEPLDLADAQAFAGLLRGWGELNLRHALTNVGFDEYADAVAGAIRRMVSGAMTGSRFACWAACRALWPVAADDDAPHQIDAEDALVSLGSVFPRVAWPGIALSLLEWNRHEYERARDLLETAVESDARALQSWQLLALLYEETGDGARAIEVCREAIMGNVADATLYYNLGRLLLDQTEDDEQAEAALVEEARRMFVEAEARGLATPDLYLRIMDACEALDDEPGLWAAFARLIQVDSDGGTLWGIIEDADTYDDFGPGLTLLQQAADSMPDAYEPLAAYVRALITLDRHAEAAETLPRLRQAATDDYARAETAQLALEAAAPDFEEAFGELVDEIESGELPDSGSIGLLTDALAREPAFADGAVTLAQCYQLHDQAELALQTLNAARAVLPDHLELVLSIADVLWSIDEDEQALDVMQDALAKHPDDVAILARLGEYYVEIGEDDKARELLRRAEAIDPRHPELMRVREEIALEMAGMEDDDVDVDVDMDDAT